MANGPLESMTRSGGTPVRPQPSTPPLPAASPVTLPLSASTSVASAPPILPHMKHHRPASTPDTIPPVAEPLPIPTIYDDDAPPCFKAHMATARSSTPPPVSDTSQPHATEAHATQAHATEATEPQSPVRVMGGSDLDKATPGMSPLSKVEDAVLAGMRESVEKSGEGIVRKSEEGASEKRAADSEHGPEAAASYEETQKTPTHEDVVVKAVESDEKKEAMKERSGEATASSQVHEEKPMVDEPRAEDVQAGAGQAQKQQGTVADKAEENIQEVKPSQGGLDTTATKEKDQSVSEHPQSSNLEVAGDETKAREDNPKTEEIRETQAEAVALQPETDDKEQRVLAETQKKQEAGGEAKAAQVQEKTKERDAGEEQKAGEAEVKRKIEDAKMTERSRSEVESEEEKRKSNQVVSEQEQEQQEEQHLQVQRANEGQASTGPAQASTRRQDEEKKQEEVKWKQEESKRVAQEQRQKTDEQEQVRQAEEQKEKEKEREKEKEKEKEKERETEEEKKREEMERMEKERHQKEQKEQREKQEIEKENQEKQEERKGQVVADQTSQAAAERTEAQESKEAQLKAGAPQQAQSEWKAPTSEQHTPDAKGHVQQTTERGSEERQHVEPDVKQEQSAGKTETEQTSKVLKSAPSVVPLTTTPSQTPAAPCIPGAVPQAVDVRSTTMESAKPASGSACGSVASFSSSSASTSIVNLSDREATPRAQTRAVLASLQKTIEQASPLVLPSTPSVSSVSTAASTAVPQASSHALSQLASHLLPTTPQGIPLSRAPTIPVAQPSPVSLALTPTIVPLAASYSYTPSSAIFPAFDPFSTLHPLLNPLSPKTYASPLGAPAPFPTRRVHSHRTAYSNATQPIQQATISKENRELLSPHRHKHTHGHKRIHRETGPIPTAGETSRQHPRHHRRKTKSPSVSGDDAYATLVQLCQSQSQTLDHSAVLRKQFMRQLYNE